MSARTMSLSRQLGAAARILLVMTVLVGVLYPAAVWGVGRLAFPGQANGSTVMQDGRVVGSSLIGQRWAGLRWFHGRPSTSAYAGDVSGGSNLPAGDPRLLQAVALRRAAAGPIGGQLPPDARTASASGLDPDISPAYARLQVPRVAAARHLTQAAVAGLVASHTDGRVLGFLGEPRVDVLELNLALQKLGR